MRPSRSRASTSAGTSTQAGEADHDRAELDPRVVGQSELNQPGRDSDDCRQGRDRRAGRRRTSPHESAGAVRHPAGPPRTRPPPRRTGRWRRPRPAPRRPPSRSGPRPARRSRLRRPSRWPPRRPAGSCSSLAREIGASSSQKPSAAEASTGPNSRLAASATATAAAKAAQGRMVRADRQDAVVHGRDGALRLQHDVDEHRADHQGADHRDVRVVERLHQVAGGPALAPVLDQPLELARVRTGGSRPAVLQSDRRRQRAHPRGAPARPPGSRPARPAPVRGWRRRSPAPTAARP